MIEKQKQETITEFFSANPAKYFSTYGSTTPDGHSFQEREKRLLELLGNGNGRLLDIGCGPGVTTDAIIKLGWQYEGADVSEAMINEARGHFPNVNFHVATVEHIPTEDNFYDAVVAMGLVEYVEDDAKAIHEMARVLKPGGRIFISLPNWWSPLRMWDRYLIAPLGALAKKLFKRERRGVSHREYILPKYRKLLKNAGLQPVKTQAYNVRIIPRPFDDWFPLASVTLSRGFEWLAKTPLSFIATGVIIEATKPD